MIKVQFTIMAKLNILFVCIHNSARSQMAEAFLNSLCGDRFEAKSGGIEVGKLNAVVVEAMREARIDISRNQTKQAFDFIERNEQFDYVITVCDEASAERCPIFPGGAKRLHWGFPDPSAFRGSPEEKLAQTRGVRDAIRAKIEEWCASEANV